MNLRNFFTDLKRRNVYKVAIARLLARLDHVASRIVNANHGIM